MLILIAKFLFHNSFSLFNFGISLVSIKGVEDYTAQIFPDKKGIPVLKINLENIHQDSNPDPFYKQKLTDYINLKADAEISLKLELE